MPNPDNRRVRRILTVAGVIVFLMVYACAKRIG